MKTVTTTKKEGKKQVFLHPEAQVNLAIVHANDREQKAESI